MSNNKAALISVRSKSRGRRDPGLWILIVITALCLAVAAMAIVMRDSVRQSQAINYSPVYAQERIDIAEAARKAEAEQQTTADAEDVQTTDELPRNEWYMQLVNREHPLSADHSIESVVYRDVYIDERWVDSLIEMDEAAADDGVELLPYSGYRNYETQLSYFNAIVDANLEAGLSQSEAESPFNNREDPPEYSEHFLGLGIDILAEDYQTKDSGFADTAEYDWLMEHAADYGFIARYPAGKEGITGMPFQPYHFRYVGVEQAKLIKASGLTLEEYLG